MVFGEPWFEGAALLKPASTIMHSIKVLDLVNQEDGRWDIGLLIEYFGYENCMVILNTVPVPVQSQQNDALLCSLTSQGGYRVKEAYNYMRGLASQGVLDDKPLWDWIWKKGDVVSRVRLFLWKMVQKAIPLGSIMVSRGIRANVNCAICGDREEDLNHMLFLCDFARQGWFASSLGLNSHLLTEPIKDTLRALLIGLLEE